MACGLKKQTNQGGVHLTERTCSPYNPIIKQIVDDCLGLPIYPVTSVDAIIDEDGNTLRKVLEDFLNQIKDEKYNVQEVIDELELSLQDLNDQYAGKTEFEKLKALVWAISSLANAQPEQNLYTGGIPTIVAKINELEAAILNINSPGLSEEDLALINTLKEILVAVANYDTTYQVQTGSIITPEDGKIKIIKTIMDLYAAISTDNWNDIEGNSLGSLLEIIKFLYTLVYLLEAYVNDINPILIDLEEKSVRHAHLDPEVLAQKPEEQSILLAGSNQGLSETIPDKEKIFPINKDEINNDSSEVNPGGFDPSTIPADALIDPNNEPTIIPELQEDQAVLYYKLKASEYPVTSIYVVTADNIQSIPKNRDRFIYFGLSGLAIDLLQCLDYDNDGNVASTLRSLLGADVFPFGRNGIHDVYRFVGENMPSGGDYDNDDSHYEKVMIDENTALTVGDGFILPLDVWRVADIFTKAGVFNPETSDFADLIYPNLQEGLIRLFIKNPCLPDNYLGEDIKYIRLGDSNDDLDLAADTQHAADLLFASQTLISADLEGSDATDLPDPIQENANYIYFYPANSSEPLVKYPCIDGKIYVDLSTNKLYRFYAKKGLMVEIKNKGTEASINTGRSIVDMDVPYLFGTGNGGQLIYTQEAHDEAIEDNPSAEELPLSFTALYNITSISLDEELHDNIDLATYNTNFLTLEHDFPYCLPFLNKLGSLALKYKDENFDNLSEQLESDLITWNVLEYDVDEGFAWTCKVDITIKFKANPRSGFAPYIIFTVRDKILALPNTIYNFNDFGLLVKFKEDSYNPIIVNNERGSEYIYYPASVLDPVLNIKNNKYTTFTSVNGFRINVIELLLIPGYEVIEVMGQLRSSDRTLGEDLNCNYINEVTFIPSLDSLLADHRYRFRLLNDVCEFIDLDAQR